MFNFTNQAFTYVVQPGDHYGLLAQRYDTTAEAIAAANPGVHPYYLQVGQFLNIPMTQHRYQPVIRQEQCISQAAVELMRDNRSLWEEHVAWTRMAIISLTFNLPDTDFVLARLLQNATDMGNMIRPLYGDAAADQYAKLIKEHLLIAADLVKAALAGDEEGAKTAEQKWFANADEIAIFLNRINRYLTEEEVREMFYEHLNLTKQEALFMINMDYEKDIEVYDQIVEQAREMADMISEAMIKLYPDLFMCDCN